MNDDYEVVRELTVKVDSIHFVGRYRVMSGTVIVYFESEIKFAEHNLTAPQVVARWLLTDLVRRVAAKRAKCKK
jgi:hypothetical protein